MTARIAAVAVAALLLGRLDVSAGVVDCLHSTIPNWIRVTGSTLAADPEGLYCLTVRYFATNPVSGIQVRLDFSACCDMNLCTDIVPGQTLESCTPPILRVLSDRNGNACFHATGAGKDMGNYVQPGATN